MQIDTSLSSNAIRGWIPYIGAIAAISAVSLVGLFLYPFLAGEAPMSLFLLAVIVAAWRGGFWPGLTATVLGSVIMDAYLLPPFYSLLEYQPGDQLRMGLYFTVCVFVSWLCDVRLRAEREREVLLAREHALRSEAENANRAKDQFLAMVSHELRTPMNAILGWIQILRTKGATEGTESVTDGLGTIERNAKIQAQLVEDLLDASRMTTGKMRIQPVPIRIEDVIHSAIETVRPTVEAKNIALEEDCGGGALINGDPARLQQAFWNVLSNAVKFTPEGGRINMHLAAGPDRIVVTVTDSGAGISPELLPAIFEPFRQGSGTELRTAGLGLGLAITKAIIELHGGSIRAASRGVGKGSTFTIQLPSERRG